MRLSRNRIQRVLHLSSFERSLIWGAFWRVAITRCGLYFLPFEKVKTLVIRWGKRVRPCPVDRVVWAVQATSAVVPRSTCLVQAIAVQSLLKAQNKNSRIVLGVALGETDKFQAHAWVEYEGKIVIGEQSCTSYARLMSVNS